MRTKTHKKKSKKAEGICRMQLVCSGWCCVSICADKDNYEPDSKDIVINKACFEQLLQMIINPYVISISEYNRDILPSIVELGKPFIVKKSSLKLMAAAMEEWEDSFVIKGDKMLLKEYIQKIKKAQTAYYSYQIVFQ